MLVTDSVTESDFSKASGLSYKHESFTINGNESVPEFVFGKFLGLSLNDNSRVYNGFCGEVFSG